VVSLVGVLGAGWGWWRKRRKRRRRREIYPEKRSVSRDWMSTFW